jgi:hypothetical protein
MQNEEEEGMKNCNVISDCSTLIGSISLNYVNCFYGGKLTNTTDPDLDDLIHDTLTQLLYLVIICKQWAYFLSTTPQNPISAFLSSESL